MLGDVEAIKYLKEMLCKMPVCILELESGTDRHAATVNTIEMDTHPRRIVYEPDARHEEVWSVMRAAYLAQDGPSMAEAAKLSTRR